MKEHVFLEAIAIIDGPDCPAKDVISWATAQRKAMEDFKLFRGQCLQAAGLPQAKFLKIHTF